MDDRKVCIQTASESESRRRCSRSLKGLVLVEVEHGSERLAFNAFEGGFEADSERSAVKHGRQEANAARTLLIGVRKTDPNESELLARIKMRRPATTPVARAHSVLIVLIVASTSCHPQKPHVVARSSRILGVSSQTCSAVELLEQGRGVFWACSIPAG